MYTQKYQAIAYETPEGEYKEILFNIEMTEDPKFNPRDYVQPHFQWEVYWLDGEITIESQDFIPADVLESQ